MRVVGHSCGVVAVWWWVMVAVVAAVTVVVVVVVAMAGRRAEDRFISGVPQLIMEALTVWQFILKHAGSIILF